MNELFRNPKKWWLGQWARFRSWAKRDRRLLQVGAGALVVGFLIGAFVFTMSNAGNLGTIHRLESRAVKAEQRNDSLSIKLQKEKFKHDPAAIAAAASASAQARADSEAEASQSAAAEAQASQSAAAAAAQASQSAAAAAAAAQAAVRGTITGGVVVVGSDVDPGVYKTTGPDGSNTMGCYYAFKSGTDADAQIIDNNIVQGPATVTLKQGNVFESRSCDDWHKQ